MKKILGITAFLLLFGCTSRHDNRSAPELIDNLCSADTLTAEDYLLAVDELEHMLSDVCDMADTLIQKKVKREDIRDSLKQNKRFLMLAEHAYILDSMVLRYMNSPLYARDGDAVRKKYQGVLRRYEKRAHTLGLN